jgi:hypothetical protein
MMKVKTAAAYCDMAVASFVGEVQSGRFPKSVVIGGREHWCRNALDLALDRLTGADAKPDYLKDFEERYGPQAA